MKPEPEIQLPEPSPPEPPPPAPQIARRLDTWQSPVVIPTSREYTHAARKRRQRRQSTTSSHDTSHSPRVEQPPTFDEPLISPPEWTNAPEPIPQTDTDQLEAQAQLDSNRAQLMSVYGVAGEVAQATQPEEAIVPSMVLSTGDLEVQSLIPELHADEEEMHEEVHEIGGWNLPTGWRPIWRKRTPLQPAVEGLMSAHEKAVSAEESALSALLDARDQVHVLSARLVDQDEVNEGNEHSPNRLLVEARAAEDRSYRALTLVQGRLQLLRMQIELASEVAAAARSADRRRVVTSGQLQPPTPPTPTLMESRVQRLRRLLTASVNSEGREAAAREAALVGGLLQQSRSVGLRQMTKQLRLQMDIAEQAAAKGRDTGVLRSLSLLRIPTVPPAITEDPEPPPDEDERRTKRRMRYELAEVARSAEEMAAEALRKVEEAHTEVSSVVQAADDLCEQAEAQQATGDTPEIELGPVDTQEEGALSPPRVWATVMEELANRIAGGKFVISWKELDEASSVDLTPVEEPESSVESIVKVVEESSDESIAKTVEEPEGSSESVSTSSEEPVPVVSSLPSPIPVIHQLTDAPIAHTNEEPTITPRTKMVQDWQAVLEDHLHGSVETKEMSFLSSARSESLATPRQRTVRECVAALTAELLGLELTGGQPGWIADVRAKRSDVFRKLGLLAASRTDVEAALALVPSHEGALWSRHILALQQGELESALKDLNTLIRQRSSQQGRAYQARADVLRQLNRPGSALDSYARARQLGLVGDPHVTLREGDTFMTVHRWGDAVKCFTACLSDNSGWPDALLRRGQCLIEMGKYTDALGDLTGLNLDHISDPQRMKAAAATARGRAQAKLGAFSLALVEFNEAVRSDPTSADAFFHRGVLLRDTDSHRSNRDLSICLLIDSTHASAYFHRGVLYGNEGKQARALEDYEEALQLNEALIPAHVNLGLIHMQKKEFYLALHRFDCAVSHDPHCIRAYLCRADCYRFLDKTHLAVRDYSRVIHLKPDDHLCHLYRGRCLMVMGQLALAIEDFVISLKLNPSVVHTGVQRAKMLQFFEEHEASIREFMMASKDTPVADLFTLLGRSREQVCDYEGALVDYTRAVNLRPFDENVYLTRGMCLKAMGELKRAVSDFTRSIELRGDLAEAYHQRGVCQMVLSIRELPAGTKSTAHFDYGLTDINRAISLKPTVPAFISRAAAHEARSAFPRAIRDCTLAIELLCSEKDHDCEEHMKTLVNRGALKHKLGNYKQAIDDFDSALALDSGCTMARFNKAVTMQLMGKSEALLGYSACILQDPSSCMGAFRNRALIYLGKGMFEAALPDLEEACQLSPDDSECHSLRAETLQRLGMLKEAEAAYSVSLELQPATPSALLGRGNVCFDSESREKALLDYERALHLHPLSLQARVRMAYALQAADRTEEALETFAACLVLDPFCIPALEGRAIVSISVGLLDSAGNDLDKALTSLEANDTTTRAALMANRGVVYHLLGDLAAANAFLQRALKLDSDLTLAQYNLAVLRMSQGAWDTALPLLNSVVRAESSSLHARLGRGICSSRLGRVQNAVSDLSIVLHGESRPIGLGSHEWLTALVERAAAYRRMRLFAEAEIDLTTALRIDPNNGQLWVRLGNVIGAQSKTREAMQAFAKALAIDEHVDMRLRHKEVDDGWGVDIEEEEEKEEVADPNWPRPAPIVDEPVKSTSTGLDEIWLRGRRKRTPRPPSTKLEPRERWLRHVGHAVNHIRVSVLDTVEKKKLTSQIGKEAAMEAAKRIKMVSMKKQAGLAAAAVARVRLED